MADVRPFRGLRYQQDRVGDVGRVIAPPYDVITPEQLRRLHDESPYNIVRVELARRAVEGEAEDRYSRAASTLRAWCEEGALARDPRPAFYLYEQQFTYHGTSYRRRAFFARVRLEPWEKGIIRPHEHTLGPDKEDRLHLLRAAQANISPVYGLYRGGQAALQAPLDRAAAADPAVDAVDFVGQRHRLWVIDDEEAARAISAALEAATIYVADGHHRYETALAYRDERRAAAVTWTGEEPENFVLMALTAADDPGLLILPIHRLVRPVDRPADLVRALAYAFDVEDVTPRSDDGTAVLRLLARMNAGRTAFGGLGLREGRLFLLTLRDAQAVRRLMPEERSDAWKSLDVSVLQYGILQPLLGIDEKVAAAGANVTYTEDAAEAWEAVHSGAVPLGFLVNPTRPEHIFAVADAGDRMPQKSTFFYPKLGTGLVLYSHA